MKLYCIIALSLLLRPETAAAQQEELMTLSLQQAIEIAQENSPEAQAARHTYRAAYWNYRFFRANYLPSVTLTSSPTLNREINKITQPDGTNQLIVKHPHVLSAIQNRHERLAFARSSMPVSLFQTCYLYLLL